MALTPPAGRAARPHAGRPAAPARRGSRLPVPATTAADALAEAIVVPNALWTPAEPEAYGGVPLDEAPTLVLRRYDETRRRPPQRRPLGRASTSSPRRRTTSWT